MSEKQPVTGRLTADTKSRFEAYRDRHDISQSDAVRRLINRGLEAVAEDEGNLYTDPRTRAEIWCKNQSEEWGELFFASSALAVLSLAGFFLFQFEVVPPYEPFTGFAVLAFAFVWAVFFVVAIGSLIGTSLLLIGLRTGIAQSLGRYRWGRDEATS